LLDKFWNNSNSATFRCHMDE